MKEVDFGIFHLVAGRRRGGKKEEPDEDRAWTKTPAVDRGKHSR